MAEEREKIKCQECGMEFDTQEEHDRHMEEEHGEAEQEQYSFPA